MSLTSEDLESQITSGAINSAPDNVADMRESNPQTLATRCCFNSRIVGACVPVLASPKAR